MKSNHFLLAALGQEIVPQRSLTASTSATATATKRGAHELVLLPCQSLALFVSVMLKEVKLVDDRTGWFVKGQRFPCLLAPVVMLFCKGDLTFRIRGPRDMLEGIFWLNTTSVFDPFQTVNPLQEGEL